MYRRLEEKPLDVQGEEQTPEEICVCVCKGEQASEEDPEPEGAQLATSLAVDFDING